MQMRTRTAVISALLLAALPMACTIATPAQDRPTGAPSQPEDARSRFVAAGKYGDLPMSFEANQGQGGRSAKFLARGQGYGLVLTDRGAVLTLSQPAKNARNTAARQAQQIAPRKSLQTDTIRMNLSAANPSPAVSGQDQLPGTVNYFLGNDPAQWRTGLPTYSRVSYKAVYPGVDLVYYGNQRQLEYDFIVAPGASAKPIRLRFDGARHLQINSSGDLKITGRHGSIDFHKPFVYQDAEGKRQAVAGEFRLLADNQVTFRLGGYDHSKPLVIDPVLAYATYLGGTNGGNFGGDYATAITVDSSGNAYVTGQEQSTNFPVTQGSFQTANTGGSTVGFVTKFNATGTAVLYSTLIGGTSGDASAAIAVDGAGNAYITGDAGSANFPVTTGAFQTTRPGRQSCFVTKLNPSGSGLVYSTFLGGTYYDAGTGIVVDSSGNAYITGSANSTDFPVTKGAFQTTNHATNAASNAFVTKLNSTGSALLYSTYLGGSTNNFGDAANGIALGAGNIAYVAGVARSVDFPVSKGAFQFTNPGSSNAFVTALNASGTALVYSSFLGGTYNDQANSIAVDAAGNAYVAGQAGSQDFPVTPGAYQTTRPGSFTGFVTKFNPTGTALVYSTYLGGSDYLGSTDPINGITIDGLGDAYVVGSTSSSSYPVTPGSFQATDPGHLNAFVTKLNPAGTGLIYSTYFGGSYSDIGYGIAIDSKGDAYIAGQTFSSDLPVTSGAFQSTNHGGTNNDSNAFVAKLTIGGETTTTIASSANPQDLGDPVTFTAKVDAEYTESTPTGNVIFTVDGKATAPVALGSTGQAAYTTSTLAVGKHTIFAAYQGTSSFGPSTSATLSETIIEPTTPLPIFSPAAGTYHNPISVTLTDTVKAAAIYYTLDGTAPTTKSTLYTAPIKISATTTVRAFAVATDYLPSSIASVTYTIPPPNPAPAPTFTPVAGAYDSVQLVTLSDKAAGATLYYTTNGTTPTTASTKYTGPIVVSASETIQAIATAASYSQSPVASAKYTVTGSPTALAYPATSVATTQATLNAEVNTQGLAGSYVFHYGTSATALTSTTAKQTLTASALTVMATSPLTSLAAKTTYYFQVVVTTAGGSATSAVLSFTTE